MRRMTSHATWVGVALTALTLTAGTAAPSALAQPAAGIVPTTVPVVDTAGPPVRPTTRRVALLSYAAAARLPARRLGAPDLSLPAGSTSGTGTAAVSPAVDVPNSVSVAGVTWVGEARPGTRVEVRTRRGARWTAWKPVDYNPLEAPDPDRAEGRRARAGTEPVVITGADAVQARVLASGSPASVSLDVIDPGQDSPAPTAANSALPSTLTTAASSTTKASAITKATQLSVQTAAVAARRPSVYTRAQWGADESLRRGAPEYGAVKAAIVHHTVDANNYTAAQVPAIIRSIYAYHVVSRGWDDIGYNFLIDRFGRIWEGRAGGIDRPVVGAHTRGFNTYAFAAAAIGNFDVATPSPAIISAYQRLYAWKATLHQFDPAGYALIGGRVLRTIAGHRDLGQTACPGRFLYARIPAIRSGADSLQGYLPALTLNRDLDNFERPDVVGVDAAGSLVLYPGNGSGGLGSPRLQGGGWAGYDRLILPGDWNGDGAADLLARQGTTGGLYLYASTGAGAYRSGVRIGTGWNGMALITGVGDFNGDGRADIVARHANGNLYLFPGNGRGGFLRSQQIGGRWQAMDMLTGVGDWDGDGRVDLVARSVSGILYLYRGDGRSRFLSGTAVGPGWQGMTAVIGAGDTDRNGRNDLYARKADGTLVLYRTNGTPTRWSRTDLPTNLSGLQPLG